MASQKKLPAFEAVSFYSDGLKLAGHFTPAQGLKKGERRPSVICLHGYSGRKDVYMPSYVRELTQAGYNTLDFFHRGFGDSEGIRLRNNPWEQVSDTISALIYMQQRPEVDTQRIALYGTSFGGTVAIQAASQDKGFKCVISVGSPANVGRSFRSKRTYGEWLDWEDQLKEDRIRRVMTGQSKRVTYGELVPSGRAERDSIDTMYKTSEGYPEGYPMESYDLGTVFVPEDNVHKISPRACLFIHAERDTMVPLSEAESFYAKAQEPKQLVVLPNANHVDVYEPRNPKTFKVVIGHMKRFLKENL
jgi:dipeptidyl aminopeptidase/acylaminoacyl peptidase